MGSNSIFGINYDSNGSSVKNYVTVDGEDKSLTTINARHNNVHLGKMYGVTKVFGPTTGSSDILIDMKSTNDAHLMFRVSSTQDALVTFSEQIATSGSGTVLNSIDMNRETKNTATNEIFHTPVITDTGSTIFSEFFPTASQGGQPGTGTGLVWLDTEWILDVGSQYLLKVENANGAAGSFNVALQWYEI